MAAHRQGSRAVWISQSGSGIDLLKDFSEVAREELQALTT
jgi:hypothetical protein